MSIRVNKTAYIPNWSYTESRDFDMKNPNGRGIYVDQKAQKGVVKKVRKNKVVIRLYNGEYVTVARYMVHETRKQCYEYLGALVGNEEW